GRQRISEYLGRDQRRMRRHARGLALDWGIAICRRRGLREDGRRRSPCARQYCSPGERGLIVARRTVNEAELVDAADAMRQFCQVMKDRLNEVATDLKGLQHSWEGVGFDAFLERV